MQSLLVRHLRHRRHRLGHRPPPGPRAPGLRRGSTATNPVKLARRLALASAVVNILGMYLAAFTTDEKMLIASTAGAAVSIYGWVYFQEEAETLAHREPRHTDLVMRLRFEITDQVYKPGERLPGTRDLAAKFQLSRRSVGHALRVLHKEGLIDRWLGRGWYVSGAHPDDKPRDRIEWHLLSTTQPGQYLPPTEELCRQCGANPTTVRRVLRELIRQGIFYRERGRIYRR